MTIAWNVPGLPFTLSPSSEAVWTIAEAPATVTASAAPHSDIFIDPGADTLLNAESMLNAATLLGVPPEGDFQFSARVTVEFASTYDAGVLLLWINDRHWGKLCLELSPDGEPMIVSVVTRGVSDDANAFVVDGRTAQEFEPEGKAAEEVEALYVWLCGIVGMSTRGQARKAA